MTIQSIIKKSLLVAGAIGAVSLAAVPSVSARVHGGGLGRAVVASDNACFNLFFNGVTNICGTTKSFEVPLPADAQGVKNITFTGNGITCQGHGSDSGTTSLSNGTSVTLASGAAILSGTSTGTTLPGGGRLWLTCSVSSGGKLLEIDFNH
jgi:hypothetical protein